MPTDVTARRRLSWLRSAVCVVTGHWSLVSLLIAGLVLLLLLLHH